MQKYEGKDKDYHYFAINYGEVLGHVRIKSSVVLSGKGVAEEIAKV